MCDFTSGIIMCELRIWYAKLAIMSIDALDVILWCIKYYGMLNSLFRLNLELENEMLELWSVKWSFWHLEVDKILIG